MTMMSTLVNMILDNHIGHDPGTPAGVGWNKPADPRIMEVITDLPVNGPAIIEASDDEICIDMPEDDLNSASLCQWNLRPHQQHNYSHLYTNLEHTVMTQMSLNGSVKEFGEVWVAAVLHNRKAGALCNDSGSEPEGIPIPDIPQE